MYPKYKPEGSLIHTPENRNYTASLAGLERAMINGAVLEETALLCDSEMNLHFDLGGDSFRVHGTLLAGLHKTALDLILIKILLRAVFLDDNRLEGLDDLIGSKPFLTLQALTAAADAVALFYRSGIDYFTVRVTAHRASHKANSFAHLHRGILLFRIISQFGVFVNALRIL